MLIKYAIPQLLASLIFASPTSAISGSAGSISAPKHPLENGIYMNPNNGLLTAPNLPRPPVDPSKLKALKPISDEELELLYPAEGVSPPPFLNKILIKLIPDSNVPQDQSLNSITTSIKVMVSVC